MFTIGTLILLRGLTYIASDNAPIIIQNITITDPLLDRYVVFSISSIAALTVFILAGLFLTYTRWGREIYAIGGARNEAIAAGVPRIRPLTVSFAISAGCASLAAISARSPPPAVEAQRLRTMRTCCSAVRPPRCSAASASTAAVAR